MFQNKISTRYQIGKTNVKEHITSKRFENAINSKKKSKKTLILLKLEEKNAKITTF